MSDGEEISSPGSPESSEGKEDMISPRSPDMRGEVHSPRSQENKIKISSQSPESRNGIISPQSPDHKGGMNSLQIPENRERMARSHSPESEEGMVSPASEGGMYIPRSPESRDLISSPQSPESRDLISNPQSPESRDLISNPQSPESRDLISNPQSPESRDLISNPQSPESRDLISNPQSPESKEGMNCLQSSENFGTSNFHRERGSIDHTNYHNSPGSHISMDEDTYENSPSKERCDIDTERVTADEEDYSQDQGSLDKYNLNIGTEQVSDDNDSMDEAHNNLLNSSDPVHSNNHSTAEALEENALNESLYDVSDCQDNDVALCEEGRKANKRRSDEGLELRDELDFEEEKESGEEGEESEDEGEEKDDEEEGEKEIINKEEGELSDEDEDESLLRQEPKTVCRFFNKGQCTWGTNCRFLHPGVSDKGNYNMFAAAKPSSQSEKEESSTEKERPREVRRFVPEPDGFETAWERGLRHAKEMMKRANKRKETDADFEEKRFNLSLGQAELDRENDYYTRPASPVYKPSDEVIEYLDPFEKQAIRHFRGGHFENFEVRYNVDPAYPNRGASNIRSRRDKFEREVTERIPRRLRTAPSPPAVEEPKVVKEKRYPRPRQWKEERFQEVTVGATKGEAEVWADPWARRKTPVKRTKKKKVSRTRSYSSGSSSRSSRSSRSSSYSSYSRSRSRSKSSSRSSRSRSSSRSITPPVHPRQRGFVRGRGGRGAGANERGGRPPVGVQRNRQNQYSNQFNQPPNPPPNHPLAPAVPYTRPPIPRRPIAKEATKDPKEIRPPVQRKTDPRNAPVDLRARLPIQLKQEPRKSPSEQRERPVTERKPEPRVLQVEQQRERAPIVRKPELKHSAPELRERVPVVRKPEMKSNPPDLRERVDMFGRTIRKEMPRSPTPRSPSRSPVRPVHGRRKFSLSPSRSRSHSAASNSSSASRSPSRGRSYSKSRSGSRSHSRSSSSGSSPLPAPISPPPAKRKIEKVRRMAQGVVSYGDSTKTKAIDLSKVAGQKQQIKLTLKKTGNVRQIDKTVLGIDDDSGESDTDARILKKRKAEGNPPNPPPTKLKPRAPSPSILAALALGSSKKPSAARREELLKQLRAVEDAIARKRSKPLP